MQKPKDPYKIRLSRTIRTNENIQTLQIQLRFANGLETGNFNLIYSSHVFMPIL